MPVGRDLVVKAYLLILGRYPESEEAISNHMRHANLKALRRALLDSNEFRRSLAIPEARERLPLALPRADIETDATDEIIERCLERIASTWTHLGKEKPHFSVLTDNAFMPANLDSNIDEFWSSGIAEAKQVLSMLQRHGFDRWTDKTCVELGCGVGRVTFGLAKHFAKVHAYDISETHLAIAAERNLQVEKSNDIIWHECSRSALAAFESCDFFYSRIVLQHNPPVIIARLIENALMSIKNGGVAVFQVPTYRLGYSFTTDDWLGVDHPMDMQMHCIPQKKVFEIIARCGCKVLEIREDDNAPPISNTFIVAREVNV
jgi:SAM-dependent methyltransferase